MPTLDANGIISNYHYDNSEWYTTKEIDEVILFKNKDGERREINNWIIFSDNSELLVQMIRTEDYPNTENIQYETDIIKISTGASWSSGQIKFHGIKVLGAAGQKIKWIGNFF